MQDRGWVAPYNTTVERSKLEFSESESQQKGELSQVDLEVYVGERMSLEFVCVCACTVQKRGPQFRGQSVREGTLGSSCAMHRRSPTACTRDGTCMNHLLIQLGVEKVVCCVSGRHYKYLTADATNWNSWSDHWNVDLN